MSKLSLEERAVLYMIEELLLTPKYQIVTSLCYVLDENPLDEKNFPPDELSSLLVATFSAQNKMHDLISVLISQELEKTLDESTLFRRNCMATKQLTTYARKVGLPYAQKLFQPILLQITTLDISNYEVDVSKLKVKSDEKIEENVQNLLGLSKDIFQKILDSEIYFPTGLRIVCKELHRQVKLKYPSAEYSSVGGFIFLRFLCPVFVSPEQFGIIPEGLLTGQLRRILVLVSKILQNISNNVITNSKEVFMQKMNTFVEDSVPKLQEFFCKIVEENVKDNSLESSKEYISKDISDFKRDTQLLRITAYLKFHIHKIGVVLTSGHAGKIKGKPASLQKSELTGYLFKYNENVFGRVTEDWQKRWFILRKGQLLYFKSVQDSHPTGIIPLSSAKVQITNSDEFTFEVQLSHRTYTLKSMSLLEVEEWVRRIKEFSSFYNTERPVKKLQPSTSPSSSSSPPLLEASSSPPPTQDSNEKKWIKPVVQKQGAQNATHHRRENSDPGKLKRINIIENSNIDITELQDAVNIIPDSTFNNNDDDDSYDENNDRDNTILTGNELPTVEQTTIAVPRKLRPGNTDGSGEALSTSPRGQFLRSHAQTGPSQPSKPGPNPNVNNNNISSNPNQPNNRPGNQRPLQNPNVQQNPNSPKQNNFAPNQQKQPFNSNPNPNPNQVNNNNNNSSPNFNRPPNISNPARPTNQNMLNPQRSNPNMNSAPSNKPLNPNQPMNTPNQPKPLNNNNNQFNRVPNNNNNNPNPNPNPNNNPNFGKKPPQNQDGSPNLSHNNNPNPNNNTPNNNKMPNNQPNTQNQPKPVNPLSKSMNPSNSSQKIMNTNNPNRPLNSNPNSNSNANPNPNAIPNPNSNPSTGQSPAGGEVQPTEQRKQPVSNWSPGKSVSPNLSPGKVFLNREVLTQKPVIERDRKNLALSGSLKIKPTRPRREFDDVPETRGRGITESKVSIIPRVEHEATFGLPTKTHSVQGSLLKKNYADNSWETFWFMISNSTLHQLHSKKDTHPISSTHLRNMIITESKDIPQGIEISGARCKLTLQASSDLKRTWWLDHLKRLINADTIQIISGVVNYCFDIENQISNKSLLEISATSVYLFDGVSGESNIIHCFPVQDCRLKVLEHNAKFELKYQEEIFLFETSNEEACKSWLDYFKLAQTEYWKEMSLKSDNDSEISQKISLLPSANFQSQSGYLMKLEKDKKSWNRYWFVLNDRTLFCHKNEKTSEPLSKMILQGNMVLRFNETDTHSYIFDIVNQDITLTLESSNHINLTKWIRTFNNARKRKSLNFNETLLKKGHLLLIDKKVGNKPIPYWFALCGVKMKYFEDEKEMRLVGETSLEYCTIHTVSENQFEITASYNDVSRSYLLQTESKESLSSWVSLIKKAKLRYWQTDLERLPDTTSRGYLMKAGRNKNKWERRWFVLTENFLLYFKSPKDPTPLGEIKLEASYVRNITSPESNLRFEIQCGDRSYFLEASDSVELKLWMRSIKQAKLACWKGREEQQQSDMHELDEPEWEGYLMKRGVKYQAWKRRWFVLKYPNLYYFHSHQINPGEHAGVIPLTDMNIVENKSVTQGVKDFQFQIVTRARVYFIKADNEESMNQCISAINSAKTKYNNSTGNQTTPTVSQRLSMRSVNSQLEKSGYLVKKGRTNKVWKRRWFVLRDNLLSYYKSNQDPEPAGVIALENCSTSIADETIKKKFCFVVSSKYRNYFLQATDQYEMAGWIESINFHIAQRNTNTLPDSVLLFNKLNELLAAHDRHVN